MPVAAAATTAAPVAKAVKAASEPVIPSAANAAASPAPAKPAETIGTPTARVQSEPPGAPVPRASVPAGRRTCAGSSVLFLPAAPGPVPPTPRQSRPSPPNRNQPRRPPQSPPLRLPQNPRPRSPPPRRRNPRLHPTRHRKTALVEFIDRQILPYLRARRGERFRLGKARFSDDTFRFVKLRVAETYRSRVEEIQGWCDERRMLDLQTRLHHWLHGWLFIHVPFSFLLLMLTIWHAYVTLFYY